MQFIRKTAVGIAASCLLTLLILFGIFFGLQRVFSTPTAIKGALKDSGFYNTAVANALEQAQKDQQKQQPEGQGQPAEQTEAIPVDRAEVRQIIQKAASPEFLQQQTESVLDSVYAWLQGKTDKLVFAVDLTAVKARLADQMGQYAVDHLGSLPACPASTPASDDVDPFNATCLPRGTNVNQVADQVKKKITEGEFLKDTQLTADNIKPGNSNRSLAEQLHSVPEAYKKLNWAIYGLGVAAVLFALAVLFLSVTRRSGLKKVAILAIIAGTFSTLLGWAGSYAAQRAAEWANQSLQQSGVKVAQALANDLRTWWMGYGIFLLVLGAGTLIALHVTKPKTAPEAEKPAEPTGEEKPEPKIAPTPKKPQKI